VAAPLLERDVELDALEQAIGAAEAGTGSVVLMFGEAGIGKTSLVRAFRRRVSARARVLLGACEDMLSPRPLGPLHDAARAVPGGTLAEALAAGDPDGVLGAIGDELADRRRPTVLIVEDVHWADDATLDVLRHTGRRMADRPAVLLVSYRDDEVGPGLRRLLGSLIGETVTRMPLRPLSRDALTRLSGGDEARADELLRLTGGNPFYVSEALATPRGGVPTTVVDAVLARVHRLDPGARRALEQLAVVPTRVELPLARALLDDLSTVVAAEQLGVLEVRADALAFRHELARHAVEGAMAATDRLRYHERVVAALRAQPDPDPARIVHHAAKAGDDDAVAAYAPAAARTAARAGAQTQAAALYEEALRRRTLLPAEQQAELYEAHAWTLFHVNRRGDAVRAARAAVDLRERLDDTAALGKALSCLSLQQWADLQPAAAQFSIERAVRLLEPGGDSVALCSVLFYLGVLLINIDRGQDGLARIDDMLAMADRVGVAPLRAPGLIYRGRARIEEGDDGGLADLLAGIDLAESGGDHDNVAIGYLNLVGTLWRQARYTDLELHSAAAAAYTRDRDFPTHERGIAAYNYRLLALRGEWDTAEEGLRALVDDPEGEGMVTRHALPGLARLAVRRGRADAADLVAAAWDNAVKAESLAALAPALTAALEHAWLTGNGEAPVAAVRATLERTDRPGRRRDHVELLRWLQRLGEPAPTIADGPDEFVAGLRGDWRAAADAWARVGDPYERALELAGSGEPEPMLEALDVFEGLGAVPAAAATRLRLGALGLRRPRRGPQTATRRNPAGLTGRQLEILGLLAGGLTNAEIAERLVVSVRTVDHHVSAVLQKLGVTSRQDAARAAAELLPQD
jgi:DNA-binding CsgD family transcriptional regulator